MIKSLGLPYMGSKRKIASIIVDKILEIQPKTKYVYDLFGGGGAISFEFSQRPHIKEVYYNELNCGVVELLKKIKNEGITPDFYQWVSRSEFELHKNDTTWLGGLYHVLWSFGSKGANYVYGLDIEERKRSIHDSIVNGTPFSQNGHLITYSDDMNLKERRLHLCRILGKSNKLERLESLENLERMNKLLEIENNRVLENIHILNMHAYDVAIDTPKDETVIYLDPPYKGTAKYKVDINHDDLYNYVRMSGYPVFMSEYNAPFNCVMEIEHRATLSKTMNNVVTEKLFYNRDYKPPKQIDEYFY